MIRIFILFKFWAFGIMISFFVIFTPPVFALGKTSSVVSSQGKDSKINIINLSCTDRKEYKLNFDGMIKRWEQAKYNKWKILINNVLLKDYKISYECKLNEHLSIVAEIDTKLEPVYTESSTPGHRIRSLKSSNLDIFIKENGNTIGTMIGIGTSGKMSVHITEKEIKYCLLGSCESLSLDELHNSKGIRKIYGLTISHLK